MPAAGAEIFEHKVSKRRSSRENYFQYEFLQPKAAKDLQLLPLLFFKKSASKGGGWNH